MRITNKMLANNFLADMRLNLENLQTLQQQSTSGKEIRKPSDNPFKAVRAMQMHTDIATNKQYNENIKDTRNWLDETDTALGQLGNQMTRVRELLVSAGNAAYGSSERQKIKDEINQIVDTMSQILNSSFDGKYIFAGTRGTTKPTTIINRWETTSLVDKDGNIVKDSVAKLEGNYEGEINVDYVIKVEGEKVKVSTNKGATFDKEVKKDSEGKYDLGSGLKITIADGNLGKEFKFSCTSAQNSELAYNDKYGEELDLNKLPIEDLENWNGKFKINGQEIEVKELKIDTTNDENSSKPEELAEQINMQIKDKDIKASIYYVEGKPYIEIKSQKGEKIEITNSVDKDNKEIQLPKALEITKSNKKQLDIMGERLITEVSQGVTIEYNVTAAEIIQFTDETGEKRDLRDILKKIVDHLDSGDPAKVKEICNGDIEAIDKASNNILKLRSQVGAKQNRMKAAEEKNTQENFDMTEILSKTEDIDLTEKTMQYATMLSVYMASLQTSARVLQPTLMDYVR